jgi:hypothetical protein
MAVIELFAAASEFGSASRVDHHDICLTEPGRPKGSINFFSPCLGRKSFKSSCTPTKKSVLAVGHFSDSLQRPTP